MTTGNKAYIGEEDLKRWDGGAEKLFSRMSPSGARMALMQVGYEVDCLVSYDKGNGYSSDTINNAINKLGSNTVRLVLRPGLWVMSANITVPVNINFKIMPGAKIQTTGFTLTINGPFEAGIHQVFSGTGTVTFGSGAITAYPTWWGATASTTSDTTYEATNVAAFNYALASGCKHIVIPQGVYRFNAGLTMGNYVTMEGMVYTQGNTESSNNACMYFNLASGTAITAGTAPVLERLKIVNCETTATYNDTTYVYGANTAVCFQLVGNATVRDCTFILWKVCIKTGSATYYLRTFNLDFTRCDYGYLTNGTNTPTNIHIESPMSTYTTNFIHGNGLYPDNIKLIGGSIEGYQYVANSFKNISVYGTYMETQSVLAGICGFVPSTNDSSVSIFGCLVYLDKTAKFVDAGSLTNCSVTLSGNRYRGSTLASATAIVLALPTSGVISCTGDAFDSDVRDDVEYVDDIATFVTGIIVHPLMPAGSTYVSLSGRVYIGDTGGVQIVPQGAPTALTTAATVTIAQLLTGIITGTHTAGATQAYTLPTGTDTDTGTTFQTNEAFDWVLINLSAAAADTITVTANTAHTVVGNMIVQSAHATTGGIYGSSGVFRTRKTAANTFITYRIG